MSITPKQILASQADVEMAMKEYAGMKIIEAVQILIKKIPKEHGEQILNNVDEVIEKIL